MSVYPVLEDKPNYITKNIHLGKALEIFYNVPMQMFKDFKKKYDKLQNGIGSQRQLTDNEQRSNKVFQQKYYSMIEMHNHLVNASHDTYRMVMGIKLTVEGWGEEDRKKPENKILLDLYESKMIKGYFDEFKNVRVDCIKKEIS